MDPPQLAITVTRERRPCVQHRHVIRQQNVTLLPREPQTNTSIIQQLIHQLNNPLAIILDRDFTSRELRLRCVPRLVPAHAGRVVQRVPHDKR